MMNSSYGGADQQSDNDMFAPNPFRSAQPQPPPPQQQQFQQHADPNSGLTGTFQMNAPPPQQQAPQYLSGTMDQKQQHQQQQALQQQQEPQPGQPGQFTPGWSFLSCMRLESYQPYFNVDTADVIERIKASLAHFAATDHFRTVTVGERPEKKGPDLYGPVWIGMTLVFLLGVTSNLSGWYVHRSKAAAASGDSSGGGGGGGDNSGGGGGDDSDNGNQTMAPTSRLLLFTATSAAEAEKEFEYDLNHLVRALTIVSTFAYAMPTIYWVAATCLGVSQGPSLTLPHWLCVYGYSLTPFVLVTFMAWLPFSLLQWILLATATAMSGLLVVRNVSTPLLAGDGDASKAVPIVFAIVATHFIFFVVVKEAFYNYH